MLFRAYLFQCDHCKNIYEINCSTKKEAKRRMKNAFLIKSDKTCYCTKKCYEKGYFK